MIWHGGLDCAGAEGLKLAVSRETRDRMTPCKAVKFPLVVGNNLSIVL